jgi:plastocyanin
MKLMPMNGGDSDDDFESSHQNEMHVDDPSFPEAVVEINQFDGNESEVLMAEPVGGGSSEESLQTLGNRLQQLFQAAGTVCCKFAFSVRTEFTTVDTCHALLFVIVLSVLMGQHNTITAQQETIAKLNAGFGDLTASVTTLQSQPTGSPTLAPTSGPTVVPTSTPTSTPTKTPVATIGSRNSGTVITGRGEIAFQTPKVVPIAQKTVEGTRAWSPKTTEMYVGDTAQWSWDTNENIVESSSSFTPMAQPRFASGVLALKSSFAHTAKQPGTFYFASENTATMTGVLVVKPRVTITNGNLDVPGNFTHHGMPFGGTIFAVTTTIVDNHGGSSRPYLHLGTQNTRVEYLRGKNGGNCAQGAELKSGGNIMTRPYLPTESQLKDKRYTYKASYDSWIKLTTASGIDPKHGLYPPPKVIVHTTSYNSQTSNNFLCID